MICAGGLFWVATALSNRTARLALDRDTISNSRFRTMSSFVTPAESGNRAAQAVPQNSRPAAPTTGHKLCTSWRAIIGCSPRHRPSHGVLPFTVEASYPHAAAQRSATTPACLFGVSFTLSCPKNLRVGLPGSQPVQLQPAVCTSPPPEPAVLPQGFESTPAPTRSRDCAPPD